MRQFSGIDILLEKASGEELDYGFIIDCFKSYSNPRAKLGILIKAKALIRVKKGIYIFGKKFARSPYSVEVLANMISGPSYVSLEWACQYYGLIPEKVTTITSVTTQRPKKFNTPIGLFIYDHLPLTLYSVGVNLIELSTKQKALIASREKALIDLLVLRRGGFRSKKHFVETIFDDLRIDENELRKFDLELLKTIYKAHPHSAIKFLIQLRESYE